MKILNYNKELCLLDKSSIYLYKFYNAKGEIVLLDRCPIDIFCDKIKRTEAPNSSVMIKEIDNQNRTISVALLNKADKEKFDFIVCINAGLTVKQINEYYK